MARRDPVPLWLARPTRIAALGAAPARILAAALVVAGGLALAVRGAATAADWATEPLLLHDGIVAGIRAGGDPAGVAAAAAGASPGTAVPLPVHAAVAAALPDPLLLATFAALALAAGIAWWVRLRGVLLPGLPRITAATLLAAGLIAVAQPALLHLPEAWAALLVTLALARPVAGAAVPAALLTIAGLVAPATLPVAVLLAGVAFRREAGAATWLAALAALLVAYAAHVATAGGIVALAPRAGPGEGIAQLLAASALDILPPPLAALAAGAALLGWCALPGGGIVAGVIALCTLLALAGGGVPAGLPAVPLLLVGLAFVPDALRDLAHAAAPRRRVRVQRITQ